MAKGLGMGNDGAPNGNADGLSPLDDDFFENTDLEDDDDADYGDDDDENAGDDDDDEDEDDDDADDTDGEEGDDGQKPRKYAGMYNSVEELEKAYKGLQTQYQSTKKSLYDRLAGSSESQSNQAPPPQTQLPPLDPTLVAQAMVENPTETMKLLMEYGANSANAQNSKVSDAISLKLEISDCREKFKDFDAYSDEIASVIEKNPEIMGMKNRMDIAYKLAKSENPQKLVSQALKNGRKQGYEDAKRKSKVGATGGKGSQAKRSQPRTAESDAVDDMMSIVKARGSFGL